MKRIMITMLLMLAGCHWAAAASDDSTAAREIYNRYTSRRGYTAKIKHSQGISFVWVTAKNDVKWQALKEEMAAFETPIPIDTANLCNLSKLMIPSDVKYDSAVMVKKTIVYENGKLMDEKTEVKTDEQLDDCKAKLLKSKLVKDAAKHVGTGHITVANDDERTLCVCFYSSGKDLLSLVMLAASLLSSE